MIDIILYSVIGVFIGHLLFKVEKLKEEIFSEKMIQENLNTDIIYLRNSLEEQVNLNKSLQKQLDKFKRGY